MTPTGDGPGLPRNDADRADGEWLRSIKAQVEAARSAHRTMALWWSATGGAGWFAAWCATCGTLAEGDKPSMAALAREHEGVTR